MIGSTARALPPPSPTSNAATNAAAGISLRMISPRLLSGGPATCPNAVRSTIRSNLFAASVPPSPFRRLAPSAEDIGLSLLGLQGFRKRRCRARGRPRARSDRRLLDDLARQVGEEDANAASESDRSGRARAARRAAGTPASP